MRSGQRSSSRFDAPARRWRGRFQPRDSLGAATLGHGSGRLQAASPARGVRRHLPATRRSGLVRPATARQTALPTRPPLRARHGEADKPCPTDAGRARLRTALATGASSGDAPGWSRQSVKNGADRAAVQEAVLLRMRGGSMAAVTSPETQRIGASTDGIEVRAAHRELRAWGLTTIVPLRFMRCRYPSQLGPREGRVGLPHPQRHRGRRRCHAIGIAFRRREGPTRCW